MEAAADGGLDVGATEGGDLAELPGDLDGVVEEEAQATLVAETCRAGNLSEQDWRMEREGRDRTGQNRWEENEIDILGYGLNFQVGATSSTSSAAS